MATKMPKVPVVIVGMGWVGGIIAAELTKQGVKVVGLERGKPRSTQDYYMVHDELRYASRYDLMQDLSKETVTFRNTDKLAAVPMREYGSFCLVKGSAGRVFTGMGKRIGSFRMILKSIVKRSRGTESRKYRRE